MDGTKLKCYVHQDDGDPVCEWWRGLDEEVRAAFFAIRELLEAAPVNRWAPKLFRKLKNKSDGRCGGLGEIRIQPEDAPEKGRKKPKAEEELKYCHRIIGVEGPRDAEFTMLHPFDKKIDARYETPCGRAQERKSNVRANWTLSRECRLSDDENREAGEEVRQQEIP